jgi:GGDEF domain-containing protein
LGRNRGNEAIIEVTNAIKKVFCDADIVARMGCDEFAVLRNGVSTRTLNSDLAYAR